MRTAELRGLPKWVGLLMFVPVVNLGVYPYIAFHDGFRPPHKIGIAIGLLIAFGPIPGHLAMLETMKAALQILSVGQREQTSATKWLRKFSDQDLTLTDASGLDVMSTRRIESCWSTDRHLGLTGVQLVIHQS